MKRAKYFSVAVLLFVASLLTYHLNTSKASATVPYSNSIVDVNNVGTPANFGGTQGTDTVSVSNNGRYVAFSSGGNNLVSGDTNGETDVFVRDRTSGTTTKVSAGASTEPEISPNGRYVVYTSAGQIYEYDTQTSSTTLVSARTTGGNANGTSESPGMSADGRYVVFASTATNLVSGDTDGVTDVFVRDVKLGTTKLLSKSDSGTLGNDVSDQPSISCDGSVIAFYSYATNLVPAGESGYADIFMVQRVGGDTISDITQSANLPSYYPHVSCDGNTITFHTNATNLASSSAGIVTYELDNGSFSLDSVDSSGTPANIDNVIGLSVSGDGRFIVFSSTATNLVSGDTNGVRDVFLHDRQTGTTERVSMRNATTQATADSWTPGISGDGEHIAFTSGDQGLVSGVADGNQHVYMADSGTSICAE